jgi:hypothetical protein
VSPYPQVGRRPRVVGGGERGVALQRRARAWTLRKQPPQPLLVLPLTLSLASSRPNKVVDVDDAESSSWSRTTAQAATAAETLLSEPCKHF